MTLAEIKTAAEAATPGEWAHWMFVDSDDARFVALSREAVPWLVERVEELAEALRETSPYVRNRIVPNWDGTKDWRCETAEGVQQRVDAALARLEV